MAFFTFGGLNALVRPKSKVTRRLTTSFFLVKRNLARCERQLCSCKVMLRGVRATLRHCCRLQALVQAHAFILLVLPQIKTEAFSSGKEHV